MIKKVTSDNTKSYGQILKTTAIFGSVKLFSVLVGILKTKIIAVFLGPVGMGIFNLINYPVSLFSQLFGLGISTSGIREVAQSQDEKQLSDIATVIKYWNRTLGIIGSFVIFAIAPYISKLSFGNDSYTWAFQVLSLVVFLTNLGGEYEVLLRGRRETKLVAKAGFYSSLAGFLASIPFFYALGNTGIIVIILITALTLAFVNYLYARKLKIKPANLRIKEIIKKGRNMASMGFFIVMGDLMFTIVITCINTVIRNSGGVTDVGYFQSCMQVTQSSLNIVLLAMAADYFPRLSKIQGNINETQKVLSQQGEVATLLCCPIIVGMIIFAPLIIHILLSDEFIVIHETLVWFILATVFRLPIWANKYVVLANGKTKLFVFLELINSLLLFVFYYIGYNLFGLKGMAWGFIFQQIIYTVIQCTICYKKIHISFEIYFWKTLFIAAIPAFLVMSIFYMSISNWSRYFLYAAIFVFSIMYSLLVMNKRSNFFRIILNKIKNND